MSIEVKVFGLRTGIIECQRCQMKAEILIENFTDDLSIRVCMLHYFEVKKEMNKEK